MKWTMNVEKEGLVNKRLIYDTKNVHINIHNFHLIFARSPGLFEHVAPARANVYEINKRVMFLVCLSYDIR